MSISNFTSNLLQIKDPNVIFSEKITTTVKKSITYKVIHASLSYLATHCPSCGCINKDFSIIKHGTKSSDIRLLSCHGEPTILRLRKQRFLCQDCNSTFSAKTNIVDTNCYISKKVKLKILDELRFKSSEKDIAYRNGVSHSTVSRAIDSHYDKFSINKDFLPANLMFDEFKSTKDAKGSMSFIFADSDTHEITDIVENRQLPYLKQYFSKYTLDARMGVKTICIDMYSPYISLIKECFPKAKIIIDRFHIVQLLNRALQKTRIEAMKNLNTTSMEYKRLKRYWKLISKDSKELNGIDFRYQIHFKHWVSEKTVVHDTLSVSSSLEATYETYQLLLTAIQTKDKDLLHKIINTSLNTDISDYMKTAISTLIKYFDYISNSLDSSYSNGPLEGLNNYIKVVKRIAFGYRSFFHFRNRILITKNLIKPIKKYQAA